MVVVFILRLLLIVFCTYAPANDLVANYQVGILEMKQTAMILQSTLTVPRFVFTSFTEDVAFSKSFRQLYSTWQCFQSKTLVLS